MEVIRSILIQSLLSISALGALNFIQFDFFGVSLHFTEICDNAIDDDKDDLIDINDPDCICEILQPKSLIPNPSFEDKNCCPTSRSQLNCASIWIQASGPTTDYLHVCGWMGWLEFPPPQPFPDGDGIVGFRDGRVGQNGSSPEPSWKEYAGACLLSPLIAGKSYLFEFYIGFVNDLYSPPINITFFGTNDCTYLPFGVNNIRLGCPTNGPNWVRLGSKFVGGGGLNTWAKTSIQVRPDQNISAIAIGPDCPDVQSSVSIYYFFDNLILDDVASFIFQINEISHPCSDNFLLEVPLQAGLSYQWYKNGIAILGESGAKLKKIYGEGDFQVRTLNEEGSCRMTKIYTHQKPVILKSDHKTICKDDSYNFGNRFLTKSGSYQHTFKSKDNCDSIVNLDLKVLGILEDTLSAKIFEGDSYRLGKSKYKNKGNHIAHLESSIGCDSIVLLNLDYYQVFFPNIFSPNGDGFNDLFSLIGDEQLLEDLKISIYDRWGTKLYAGRTWDGKYNGNEVMSGVYTYTADIMLKDGYQKLLSGSLTLFR